MPNHLKLRKHFTDEFSLSENVNPLYVGLNNIGGESRLIQMFSRAWVRHFIHQHGGKIEHETQPMLLPVNTDVVGDIPVAGSDAGRRVVPVYRSFRMIIKHFDGDATAVPVLEGEEVPIRAIHIEPVDTVTHPTQYVADVQLTRIEPYRPKQDEVLPILHMDEVKDEDGTIIQAAQQGRDYVEGLEVSQPHMRYLTPEELSSELFKIFSWLRVHGAYPVSYKMHRQYGLDYNAGGTMVKVPTAKIRMADQPVDLHVNNSLLCRNVTHGDTNGTSMVHWDNNPLSGRIMSFSNATPILKDGIYGESIPRSNKLDLLSRFEDPVVYAEYHLNPTTKRRKLDKISRFPTEGEDIRSAGIITSTTMAAGQLIQITSDDPQYLTEIPRKPGDIWSNYKGSESFRLEPGSKKTVSMDFHFKGTVRKFFFGFTFSNTYSPRSLFGIDAGPEPAADTEQTPAQAQAAVHRAIAAKPAIPELSWRTTPKFGSSALLCFDRVNGQALRFLANNPNSITIKDRPIQVDCCKKTVYECQFGSPPTNSLLAGIPQHITHRYVTAYELSDFAQLMKALVNGTGVQKPDDMDDHAWNALIRLSREVAQGRAQMPFDNNEYLAAKRDGTVHQFLQDALATAKSGVKYTNQDVYTAKYEVHNDLGEWIGDSSIKDDTQHVTEGLLVRFARESARAATAAARALVSPSATINTVMSMAVGAVAYDNYKKRLRSNTERQDTDVIMG